MDLSKLPKLSNTQAEQPPASAPVASDDPTPTRPVEYRGRPSINEPELGADIWVNAIIGLLLIGMGFTFAKFLSAKLTGQPFHTNVNWTTGPNAGSEVAYFDLQGYTAWTDMGMFLFGVVLLLEAAAKTALVLRPGAVSRAILLLALVLTAATTALNIYVCFKFLQAGSLPLLSGLAVAFGGWILADERRMLRHQT
ncbi:MAG TPA: hypothetical protein VLI90_17175 [Tepidisphaeraceae bacterium]|nr:hypothetical protein [Tepidisphaeraceae bacterium]